MNYDRMLINVIQCKSLPDVENMLDKGANVNAKDRNSGRTALVVSVYGGDKQITRKLIDAGADVNANNNGETDSALTAAVEMGQLDFVCEFLNLGADVNAVDKDGMTALCWAALHGYTEIAERLIFAGADVNIYTKENDFVGGIPALSYAAMQGHTKIVHLLVKAGAILDVQDNMGTTPLMSAVTWGLREAAQELIQAGADLTMENANGETALDLSLQKNHNNIAVLIKSHIEKQAERQEHIFDLNI